MTMTMTTTTTTTASMTMSAVTKKTRTIAHENSWQTIRIEAMSETSKKSDRQNEAEKKKAPYQSYLTVDAYSFGT